MPKYVYNCIKVQYNKMKRILVMSQFPVFVAVPVRFPVTNTRINGINYKLRYFMIGKRPNDARDYCVARGERVVYIDSEQKQTDVTMMSGE